MIHTLIIETENLSEVIPLVEFAEKLGASVKITPKLETSTGQADTSKSISQSE